ncbi:MAG TPA: TIGR03435 family protein [Terracidiphilus sp.]|nr:TIGR03435 family protein [Terracidiphilus sp.]
MVLETCKADLVSKPVRGARACRFLLSIFFALSLAAVSVRSARAQTKPAVAAADETPHFEVAAIKPSKPDDRNQSWHGSADRILIENYTLRHLIKSAYGLKTDAQVLSGPDWLDKQAFDISAKIDETEIAKMKSMDWLAKRREQNAMLQSLLVERFALKARLDQRKMPVFALVIDKSGAKLTPTSPEAAEKGNHISTTNGRMIAIATSMDAFADDLDYQRETGGRMVLNQTGLTGEYDFKLNWAQDNGDGTTADPALPGLFTALREQLGLKLQPEKGSVEVVVIESANKPAFD